MRDMGEKWFVPVVILFMMKTEAIQARVISEFNTDKKLGSNSTYTEIETNQINNVVNALQELMNKTRLNDLSVNIINDDVEVNNMVINHGQLVPILPVPENKSSIEEKRNISSIKSNQLTKTKSVQNNATVNTGKDTKSDIENYIQGVSNSKEIEPVILSNKNNDPTSENSSIENSIGVLWTLTKNLKLVQINPSILKL